MYLWSNSIGHQHKLMKEEISSVSAPLVEQPNRFFYRFMAHDTKSAACIDSICRRDDRPRYSCADLRRFRNGVAACRALGPRSNGSCLRFGRHHAFGRHWVAGATYGGMVGSHSIPLYLYLDVPEVACALRGAWDGS